MEMLSETTLNSMEPKPRPRHYSFFHPFPFLPLPKLTPFLGWTGLQSLPEIPGALPQVGTGGNIPFLHGN